MAGTEQTKIEVLLDGRAASEQLRGLAQNAAALRMELARAYESNDAAKVAETELALSRLDTQMKQLRRESVDVKAVLDNLSGATMQQLRQATAAVDSQLNSRNIRRNSEEWNKLVEVKRTLAGEQKRLRQEMGQTDSSIKRQRLSVADWVVSMGVAERAISGVKDFLRDSLYSFQGFEKGVKGLSSLTGLQGSDLAYLSEEAKKLSTSTLEGGIIIQQGATQIVDAYKMIGSQRPELLGNKEALNQVTQEAIILSEAAEMELEPAAAALTNSLNQFNASAGEARRYINVLAAGSQAGAGNISYLSDAIEKSGTSANLMGMDFEQLVALIETAAPKFSEAATAGNSIDKVLQTMKANQIGYRDGVFGISAALDEMAARLAGGELASGLFGKEHAKMVEVLVDGRAEFTRYQEAVTGTDKAVEQAVTNTDTSSARLQQQKNRLEQLRIELGEKLTPLMGTFTSGTASLTQVLIGGVGVMSRYGTIIGWVTAAIVAQTVAMKYKISLASISEKLSAKAAALSLAEASSVNANTAAVTTHAASVSTLTAVKLLLANGIKVATLAVKGFFTALASNPLGLILTAITALGVGIYKVATYMSESEKAVQRVRDAHAEFEKAAAMEKYTLDQLFGTLKGAKEGTEDWEKARKAITDKYGSYLSDLGMEINSLADAELAYKALSGAIYETARAKAKQQTLDDAMKSRIDTEKEQMKKIREEIYDTWDDPKKAAEYFQVLAAEMEKGGQMSRKATSVMFSAGIEREVRAYYDAAVAFRAAEKEAEDIFRPKQGENAVPASGNTPDPAGKTGEDGKTVVPPETAAEKKARETRGKEEEKRSKEKEKERGRELQRQEEHRQAIIAASRSAIEQEQADYEKRQQDAGVSVRNLEKLQASEISLRDAGNTREADQVRQKMKVIGLLQRTHEANIRKITSEEEKKKQEQLSKSINTELQSRRSAFGREIAEMHIRQNQELTSGDLAEKQRKEMKDRHRAQEREASIRQGQELVSLMQDALNGTEIEGIDLAGKIFSPEEKEKLGAEILKLRESISGMMAEGAEKPESAPDSKGADYGVKLSDVDVLGLTSDQWETFEANLKDGKFGVEEITAATGAAMQAWATFDQFVTASENRQLKQYEKSTKKKKAALENQLAAGRISQEQYNAQVAAMDAEMEARQAEMEVKQARRQKAMSIMDAIINTAVAVTAALGAGPLLGPILAGIVGAMGAAQVATILAQPLPGAEEGGFIDVVRSQDGKPFRAKDEPGRRGYVDRPTVITGESGREFVASDAAVANPTVRPVLDVIDAAQRSGTIGRLDLTRYLGSVAGRSSGGTISGAGMPSVPATQAAADPALLSLLQKNIEMMQILASKKIEIPWYGRGGLDEKMQKAGKYEKEIRP